jgi:hypothetical protein
MKIVLVDDDKLVGISLKTIIEAESGMEVTGMGHSGRDAVPCMNDTPRYPPDGQPDGRQDWARAGETILARASRRDESVSLPRLYDDAIS